MRIFELLFQEKGAHLFDWLPIVKDVRAALAEDPLPIETMKELLAAA